MKILLEVNGGVITNIITNKHCELVVIDWDDIKQGYGCLNIFSPDYIIPEHDKIHELLKVLNYDENVVTELKQIDF